MKRNIIVDNRWQGNHGIGRYAREVVSRLPESRVTLYNDGNPLSIVDTVTAATRNLGSISYSPGYNFFNANPSRSIVTIHDLLHLEFPRYRSIRNSAYYNCLIRPICRKAPFVFTVSNISRSILAEWAKINPERIIVTGNGISDNFCLEGEKFQPDYPYFLHVGNYKPHKNVALLIEAFGKAQLPSECRLLLVGNFGPYAKRLESKRIVLLPEISDHSLASIYRGCVGFVQPSLQEGFGLPIVEAMACGAPILASNIRIFHEVADNAATYFDPLSSESMTRALEKLYMDQNSTQGQIKAGIKRSQIYNWENVAKVVNHNLLTLI